MVEIDEQLREVFTSYPEVELVILFGSLAREEARANSDIDLAVLANKTLDMDRKIALIDSLAVALGRPVDLIDLRTAGEPLLGQILRGRKIVGSDTAYARLLARHLFEAADFLPYRNRILKERRERWINS